MELNNFRYWNICKIYFYINYVPAHVTLNMLKIICYWLTAEIYRMGLWWNSSLSPCCFSKHRNYRIRQLYVNGETISIEKLHSFIEWVNLRRPWVEENFSALSTPDATSIFHWFSYIYRYIRVTIKLRCVSVIVDNWSSIVSFLRNKGDKMYTH